MAENGKPQDDKYEVLVASRFYLELKLKDSDDRIDAYFMECQSFKRKQDVIEHCEVFPKRQWGSKPAKHGQVVRAKLPGNSQSENITLKMGMTISPTMWKWFKEVESGNWAEQRRDGALTIYSQKGDVEALFHFFGAWPVSYKIGDVKADSTDFEIEEVELAVDEFIRVNTNGQAF